jgi:hypothetical protein
MEARAAAVSGFRSHSHWILRIEQQRDKVTHCWSEDQSSLIYVHSVMVLLLLLLLLLYYYMLLVEVWDDDFSLVCMRGLVLYYVLLDLRHERFHCQLELANFTWVISCWGVLTVSDNTWCVWLFCTLFEWYQSDFWVFRTSDLTLFPLLILVSTLNNKNKRAEISRCLFV